MGIHVLTIGARDPIENRINMCLMLLDMGDRKQISEGRNIIYEINKALRRKSTPEETKASLRKLKAELKERIKELSK